MLFTLILPADLSTDFRPGPGFKVQSEARFLGPHQPYNWSSGVGPGLSRLERARPVDALKFINYNLTVASENYPSNKAYTVKNLLDISLGSAPDFFHL